MQKTNRLKIHPDHCGVCGVFFTADGAVAVLGAAALVLGIYAVCLYVKKSAPAEAAATNAAETEENKTVPETEALAAGVNFVQTRRKNSLIAAARSRLCQAPGSDDKRICGFYGLRCGCRRTSTRSRNYFIVVKSYKQNVCKITSVCIRWA